MECPACKRTHPRTFKAVLLTEVPVGSQWVRGLRVLVCRKCGALFAPVTPGDAYAWGELMAAQVGHGGDGDG